MNVNNVLLSVAVVCSVASMFASAHMYLRQRDFEQKIEKQINQKIECQAEKLHRLDEVVKDNIIDISKLKQDKMSENLHRDLDRLNSHISTPRRNRGTLFTKEVSESIHKQRMKMYSTDTKQE